MLALSHMAVQCSLYLHQQLEQFSIGGPSTSASLTTTKKELSLHKSNSTEKEEVYLRTHTGLGYGEVKVYNVGGVSDRWLYVLGGSAVEQLTSTVAQAGSNLSFKVLKIYREWTSCGFSSIVGICQSVLCGNSTWQLRRKGEGKRSCEKEQQSEKNIIRGLL